MPKIRLWPLLAVVLLGASVGLGALVTRTDLLTVRDRAVSDQLHALDSGWLHAVASAVGTVLSPLAGIVILAVWAVGLVLRSRRLAALSTVITLCAGWGCALVIKEVIDRPRPPFEVAEGPSYPSGHTALATAIVFAAFFLARRTNWRDTIVAGGGLILALVMFSRAISGAHYLTDTVGSVLAASGAVVLASGIWQVFARWLVRSVPALPGDRDTVTCGRPRPSEPPRPTPPDRAPRPTGDPVPGSPASDGADHGPVEPSPAADRRCAHHEPA